MKTIFISFKQLFSQIKSDKMLFVVCLAPIFAGIAFKFGIPYIESLLCDYFGEQAIIQPYYLMIDIFLAILTPNLFCFASAMVILEEKDEHLIESLSVTPLGKTGYLISRLILPLAVSAIISIIMLLCFSLTEIKFYLIIILSILSATMGLMISLLIVSFSKNKVEGMAFSKLGGLFMLGIPVAFFIDTNNQYFASLMPSFWVAKFMIDFNIFNLTISVLVVTAWIYFFYKRFIYKIN